MCSFVGCALACALGTRTQHTGTYPIKYPKEKLKAQNAFNQVLLAESTVTNVYKGKKTYQMNVLLVHTSEEGTVIKPPKKNEYFSKY